MPDTPFVAPNRQRDIRAFAAAVAKLCAKYKLRLDASADATAIEIIEDDREYPEGYSWSARLSAIHPDGPVDLHMADWVDDDEPEVD